MRGLIIPALLAFALIGCNAHPTQLSSEPLAPLAQALQDVWPRSNYDLELTITSQVTPKGETLHCRLRNTSAGPLTLNKSALPWLTPGLFSVGVVDGSGEVVYRTVIVEQIMNEPAPLILGSGQILEGDINPKFIGLTAVRRDKALLLIWSRGIELMGPVTGIRLSGVTFLPKLDI